MMTDQLTAAEIAELRALEAQATPATWHASDYLDSDAWGILSADNGIIIRSLGQAREGDLRLIAALRNAAPRLLEAAEEREQLRLAYRQMRDQCTDAMRDANALQEECERLRAELLTTTRALGGEQNRLAKAKALCRETLGCAEAALGGGTQLLEWRSRLTALDEPGLP